MANTKISALTAATSVAGTEQIPLATAGGANNKITPETLASVIVHPGYVAGRWYASGMGIIAGGSATASNVIKLYPFLIQQRVTISDLGCRVVTGIAASHMKAGIYASDATNKLPTGTVLGTVVLDTSTSSTTPSTTLSANISLTPGIYWMATLSDNTPTCNTMDTKNLAGGLAGMIGNATFANLWPGSAAFNTGLTYSTGVTYAGGFIDLTSVTLTENGSGSTVPAIAFKVASVP